MLIAFHPWWITGHDGTGTEPWEQLTICFALRKENAPIAALEALNGVEAGLNGRPLEPIYLPPRVPDGTPDLFC
jgi:hypothetical protein